MHEIDRGEMPVERYRNAHRTYFSKKMQTYYEANWQCRHLHDLGIENLKRLEPVSICRFRDASSEQPVGSNVADWKMGADTDHK
jgi:hypothetical protein